jgi:hypothetical protein
MSEKVYITSENTVVFRCPNCQRTKTVPAKDLGDRQPLRFKLKCPCGQITVSTVEKRRQYRKEIDLPGSYIHYVDGQARGNGLLRVRDISARGMNLFISTHKNFTAGDILKVSFTLDDACRSRVEKKVVIRRLTPPTFGVEFAPNETLDKALGFYLLS